MDVNPSFQELLETLSQGSTKSANGDSDRLNRGSRGPSCKSAGKLLPSGSSTLTSSFVDEAYRRVGQKLSMQAHGENPSSSSSSVTAMALDRRKSSCFDPYVRQKGASSSAIENALDEYNERTNRIDSSVDDRYRTPKVAKTRYSDHGEHHLKHTINILRRLTLEGRQAFVQWEQHMKSQQRAEKHNARRVGDDEYGTSPQRHAFSRLALEGRSGGADANANASREKSAGSQHSLSSGFTSAHATASNGAKGLLSAVLEGHSESNTTPSGQAAGYGSATPSISTKGSKASFANGMVEVAGANGSTRGRCLTAPSDPVTNDGRDNIEGNLIVFEYDSIKIPRRNVHTTGGEDTSDHTGMVEYRVQGLLGQGTFAQVFKCLHVSSGKIVAVKVVKNKPAYTRQATVEIDVFRALKEGNSCSSRSGSMVDLICFFMHHSHLCLVFELLGQNLYEILKRRQFRGLPLTVVQGLVRQMVLSMRELSQKSIVHCDLKPENVLLLSDSAADEIVAAGEGRWRTLSVDVASTTHKSQTSRDLRTLASSPQTNPSSGEDTVQTNHKDQVANDHHKSRGRIKLIDFGSACFEGYTAHTYIQSRFYRSPEVLIGLPYDSVIDIWSLGCVAAELFLGLPILPGMHEHDQLGRITEMIGHIPDWMIDQGSKATKYYVKYLPRPGPNESASLSMKGLMAMNESPAPPGLPQWRLKTQQEYIASLSQAEIRKKGGIVKLEQQPGNRYFKRTRLGDVLFLHGLNTVGEDKELLPAFVHFLYGLLEPDPWKRWTSFQAVQHPFITGELSKLKPKPLHMVVNHKEENQANIELNVYWEPPWDPSICRRKLINVQRMREKQQQARRNVSGRPSSQNSGQLDPANDRQWARRGSSSPAFVKGMAKDTSGSRDGNMESPPRRIGGGAGQTTQDEEGRSAGTMANPRLTSNFMVSSSLTSLGQADDHSKLVMGNGTALQRTAPSFPSAMLNGPQSYSGLRSYPVQFLNEDFAHALQRPGVVPGTGPDASVSTHGTWGYNHATGTSYAQQMPQSASINEVSFDHSGTLSDQWNHQGAYLAGSSLPAQPLVRNLLPSVQGQHGKSYVNQAMNYPSSYGSSSIPYGSHFNPMFSDGSVASSVTMSESAPIDLQHQMLLLQQQQARLIQQQQQLLAVDAQLGSGAQLGHMMQQQAPLYLAAQPGGGTYYVTTSATGQPILLQPFAFFDPSTAGQMGSVFPTQPMISEPSDTFQQYPHQLPHQTMDRRPQR